MVSLSQEGHYSWLQQEFSSTSGQTTAQWRCQKSHSSWSEAVSFKACQLIKQTLIFAHEFVHCKNSLLVWANQLIMTELASVSKVNHFISSHLCFWAGLVDKWCREAARAHGNHAERKMGVWAQSSSSSKSMSSPKCFSSVCSLPFCYYLTDQNKSRGWIPPRVWIQGHSTFFFLQFDFQCSTLPLLRSLFQEKWENYFQLWQLLECPHAL